MYTYKIYETEIYRKAIRRFQNGYTLNPSLKTFMHYIFHYQFNYIKMDNPFTHHKLKRTIYIQNKRTEQT